MKHLYGEFSDMQILNNAKYMHNEIHKLLLYKDNNVKENIFNSDEDFKNYFQNLLIRFSGLNKLLGEPVYMIHLLSTLQSAYDEVNNIDYNYHIYRKLILDAHGYIKAMFEEV